MRWLTLVGFLLQMVGLLVAMLGLWQAWRERTYRSPLSTRQKINVRLRRFLHLPVSVTISAPRMEGSATSFADGRLMVLAPLTDSMTLEEKLSRLDEQVQRAVIDADKALGGLDRERRRREQVLGWLRDDLQHLNTQLRDVVKDQAARQVPMAGFGLLLAAAGTLLQLIAFCAEGLPS